MSGSSPLLARFADAAGLVAALERLAAAGIMAAEIYAPHPVPEAEPYLAARPSPVPLAVLVAGLVGLAGGFAMEVYAATRSYPINIGGRPLFSWPAFVPIAFEIGVLCAVVAGFLGFLIVSRLPHLSDGIDSVLADAYILVLPATERQTARALLGPAVMEASR